MQEAGRPYPGPLNNCCVPQQRCACTQESPIGFPACGLYRAMSRHKPCRSGYGGCLPTCPGRQRPGFAVVIQLPTRARETVGPSMETARVTVNQARAAFQVCRVRSLTGLAGGGRRGEEAMINLKPETVKAYADQWLPFSAPEVLDSQVSAIFCVPRLHEYPPGKTVELFLGRAFRSSRRQFTT